MFVLRILLLLSIVMTSGNPADIADDYGDTVCIQPECSCQCNCDGQVYQFSPGESSVPPVMQQRYESGNLVDGLYSYIFLLFSPYQEFSPLKPLASDFDQEGVAQDFHQSPPRPRRSTSASSRSQSSRSQSSRSQSSRSTSSKYTGSKYTGSKYTGSKYTGSKYTGSKYTGSKYTSSKPTSSKYTSQKYSSSKPSSYEATESHSSHHHCEAKICSCPSCDDVCPSKYGNYLSGVLTGTVTIASEIVTPIVKKGLKLSAPFLVACIKFVYQTYLRPVREIYGPAFASAYKEMIGFTKIGYKNLAGDAMSEPKQTSKTMEAVSSVMKTALGEIKKVLNSDDQFEEYMLDDGFGESANEDYSDDDSDNVYDDDSDNNSDDDSDDDSDDIIPAFKPKVQRTVKRSNSEMIPVFKPNAKQTIKKSKSDERIKDFKLRAKKNVRRSKRNLNRGKKAPRVQRRPRHAVKKARKP